MTNFLWRRRRNRDTGGKILDPKRATLDMELTVPAHFRCPISLDLMKDPVSLLTGITYDRESIERWIDMGHATCPVTNLPLTTLDQIPNHALRQMIQEWCVENRSHGFERVPTPRVPIAPSEVSNICAMLLEAAKTQDEQKCRELVAKVKDLAKESERNRRCISSNGFGLASASAFEMFTHLSFEKYSGLLREILSVLMWNFPREREGISKLGVASSISILVRFLGGDDLSSRRDATLVLSEMVLADETHADILTKTEGAKAALFQAVKLPICPQATQACLVIIRQMLLSEGLTSPITSPSFTQMGLVSLLLDIIVEGNKGICEKAIGVLDVICDSGEGKESARSNALAVPLIAKKILRVSDLVTELSVSILWKLVVGGNEGGLVEALGVGAFQKLLVVLQVGCGEETKEKVTELLKLMNGYRDMLDCFDSSMGFKELKKT